MRQRSARAHGRPWLVGLSGLQGSGKSTLADQLATAAGARGIRSRVLALDDFYLGRRARAQLARTTHPLLATRGVPGTHDVALLDQVLDALRCAGARHPARIPRFDKGRDTRLPPSRWRRIEEPPQLVIVEGWCVGVPAEDARALATPANALERDEDRDGRWRQWVNARLGADYAALWRRLDRLVVLEAPDFAIVTRWRGEQERALRRRRAPQAMDATALRRFLMHYERLSRHALRVLPARADLRIRLGSDRAVLDVVARRTAREVSVPGAPASRVASRRRIARG